MTAVHALPSEPPPVNVAAHLPRMAKLQPDALAVAVAGRKGFTTLSFGELDRRSDRIAHALVSVGIVEGTRTVLMVKPSPEFFALTFAMLKVGAIPVMVDPGMGVRNLGTCLAEAEPEAFIGIPKAHVARTILGWGRRTIRTTIMVGPRVPGMLALSTLEARAPSTPYPTLQPDPEQTAAILFTSGSTGVPKGTITPFGVFAAQVELLRACFGIEPGERDLSTFPLFALFGPALGMASIVPDMDASRPADADPRALLDALTQYRCTNMFASPALVDKLGRHCAAQGVKLSSLRRAISAGAPASIPSVERFAALLPEGAEVYTPYGATEALPVSVIGSGTILSRTRTRTEQGAGVCVGKPAPGIDVAIVPITDDPIPQWSDDLALPPNAIGEIVVKGPVVTPGYYNRAQSTALAKIRDGATLRHRMGDVGYLDDDGNLWMCGRKAHRVELPDGPRFTIPCEAPFNAHPAVFRSALVGARRGDRTIPVLCVELEKGASIDREELLAIARAHPHTACIETFLFHPRFPVDVRHNSKIFREQLAIWAQEQLP